MILDEFADIIPKFISLDSALELIDGNREFVITGHRAIDALIERADYVSEIEKIKHPYDSGTVARRGIEY